VESGDCAKSEEARNRDSTRIAAEMGEGFISIPPWQMKSIDVLGKS
jgi:hypothetical protein